MLTWLGINWSEVELFDSTHLAGTSGFPPVELAQ